jgi:hypothetical protein
MKFKKDDYIVRYDKHFLYKKQRVVEVIIISQIYILFDLDSGYVGDFDFEHIDNNYELDIKRMRKYKLRRINKL